MSPDGSDQFKIDTDNKGDLTVYNGQSDTGFFTLAPPIKYPCAGCGRDTANTVSFHEDDFEKDIHVCARCLYELLVNAVRHKK